MWLPLKEKVSFQKKIKFTRYCPQFYTFIIWLFYTFFNINLDSLYLVPQAHEKNLVVINNDVDNRIEEVKPLPRQVITLTFDNEELCECGDFEKVIQTEHMRNSQPAVIVHPTQLLPVLPATSQSRSTQAGVIVTPEQAVEPVAMQSPAPTLIQNSQVGSPASAFAVPWHAVVPVLSSSSVLSGRALSPENDVQENESMDHDVLPSPADEDDDDDVFESENGDISGGNGDVGRAQLAPQRRTQSTSSLHGKDTKVNSKLK